MATYQQGELAVIRGTFTDPETGSPVDPSIVNVTIVRPDGQRNKYLYSTDAQVVKESIGVYAIEIGCDISGAWKYWWHSGGTGKAGDERTFMVESALAADAPGAPQSLQTDFGEIQRAVGRVLGIGRHPGSWGPNERADVRDIIRSGYRRYLWPPALIQSTKDERGKEATTSYTHSWSWLKPTKTLTLANGTATYDLAEDFGEMVEGGFTFTTDQQPAAIVTNEQILQMQSQAARSGVPKYAAISPIDARQTKHQVTFYPTPDAEYTVSYTYAVAPPDLTETAPIPLGGPLHAETILEACLAAAEKTLHDTVGIHEAKFMECLARSVQADINLSKTTTDPWPLEDAAKGLGINKAYLKRLVGRQLQYGPHPATWNHRQASEVDLALESGLRKFYAAFEWSFLKPIKTITTSSAVYAYDLPDGFVSLDGPLTHKPDEATLYPPVELVPETRIRHKLSLSTSAGVPQIAATRLKSLDPSGLTQYELLVWPPADGEYELSFPCTINPLGMTEDACLPYGGQQHAQTVIEACLAAAEEVQGQINGPHAVKFMEYLPVSIAKDRKATCPETLGYSYEGSDLPGDPILEADRFSHAYSTSGVVGYNGVEYE